jgi:hypothetical protein
MNSQILHRKRRVILLGFTQDPLLEILISPYYWLLVNFRSMLIYSLENVKERFKRGPMTFTIKTIYNIYPHILCYACMETCCDQAK